jgi:hypothetical protein
VTVIGGDNHDLTDGDVVRFSEVEGMVEINGKDAKVTVISPSAFRIDLDTSKFSPYSDRGRITEIKQAKSFTFNTLEETWATYNDSKATTMDFMKCLTIKQQLHLFYQALLDFQEKNRALPRPYSKEDADELLKIAENINDASSTKLEEINKELFLKLSYTSSGDLSPMACVIGGSFVSTSLLFHPDSFFTLGIVAQEVMKHAGSKFTPLNQWLFFDSLECLGKDLPSSQDIVLQGSRYDGQIAVFGAPFVQR